MACLSFLMGPSLARADISTELANVCDIVRADDADELRRKIKDVTVKFKLKLRDYYTAISCDGKSLIKLAIEIDANNAGEILIKQMPKKALNGAEQDGQSILDWVSANNYSDKPLVGVLRGRL